jgi:hypothetical protein
MVSSFFTRGVRFTNSSRQCPRFIGEILRPTMSRRGRHSLVRIRLTGTYNADKVIREDRVAARQFNLGHVAGYAVALAYRTAFRGF